MDTKSASTAPAAKPAPAPVPMELVRVALVSGVGGPMVVTKRDGERLAKTGRWKIVGPAEVAVTETKGRPGSRETEEPPVIVETKSPPAAIVEPEPETGAWGWAPRAKFGEDRED